MRDFRRTRLLPLVPAALVFMALLAGPTATRPSLAQGPDESWVPVTVVYTSDVKGHIEPCG